MSRRFSTPWHEPRAGGSPARTFVPESKALVKLSSCTFTLVVLLNAAKLRENDVCTLKSLIYGGIFLIALTGCAVAPGNYWHRGYYGHRVAIIAPLAVPMPVVVVRP